VWRTMFLKPVIVVLFVTAICLCLSCERPNKNEPDYIKDVVAYKEGSDGIFIYFILADARGAMTTARGRVEIVITEKKFVWPEFANKPLESEGILLLEHLNVDYSDFVNTKVGLGAFAREALVFPVGRLKYSNFVSAPKRQTGKVKIKFQTERGKEIEGETTVSF